MDERVQVDCRSRSSCRPRPRRGTLQSGPESAGSPVASGPGAFRLQHVSKMSPNRGDPSGGASGNGKPFEEWAGVKGPRSVADGCPGLCAKPVEGRAAHFGHTPAYADHSSRAVGVVAETSLLGAEQNTPSSVAHQALSLGQTSRTKRPIKIPSNPALTVSICVTSGRGQHQGALVAIRGRLDIAPES